MDYQEAIEIFENEIKKLNNQPIHVNHIGDAEKADDAMKTAISAMQELQEYKEYGTPNGYKSALEAYDKCYSEKEIIDTELYKYQQIGTLEEVREAVEKNTAKKPKQYRGKYHCPRCTRIVSKGSYNKRGTLVQRAYSCKYCFQRLDWGEEE